MKTPKSWLMSKRIRPSDCKLIHQIEKEEVLLDAIYKTILLTSMEYDLTIGQVCGCLDIIKSEYKNLYFVQKYKRNN